MSQTRHPLSLDSDHLALGVTSLSSVDPDLARLSAELGQPPLWARAPGFPTLVHIILEQQVSPASANAAFTRLQEAAKIVAPDTFLKLNDGELKIIGFSRQKASYCRALALAVLYGEIDIAALGSLDDAAARATLMKIRGIGSWTADIYLLMALLRPDIWPSGDLALATAIQEIKTLSSRPNAQEMDHIAAPWQPWRAVAARLLWRYYLSTRKNGRLYASGRDCSIPQSTTPDRVRPAWPQRESFLRSRLTPCPCPTRS